ncbi:hypothetical protein [Woeseia oceani]|uniref:Uncharacterized protein n=1 Tax=Woeseia oceani TaxID=1548547 RepID=A0A193LIQ4_9GAMM|nr:hypothetical protein [Woeseia oceani]ANO52323.1 hypothetical protein BA177_15025 [Woeseia oceani]
MTEIDSHLPDDIAAEKQVSRRLSAEYRNKLFGAVRKFRALRLQAPGIIAEFVLAFVSSIFAVPFLFQNMKSGGVIQDLGNTVKIILVVVACFWIVGRLWRLIGVANRDRCRYVVSNMWGLALGGLLLASVVVKVFYPEFVELP